MTQINIQIQYLAWDDIYNTENADQAYDTFKEEFVDSYNKFCPAGNVNKRNRLHKPWLSKGIYKCNS